MSEKNVHTKEKYASEKNVQCKNVFDKKKTCYTTKKKVTKIHCEYFDINTFWIFWQKHISGLFLENDLKKSRLVRFFLPKTHRERRDLRQRADDPRHSHARHQGSGGQGGEGANQGVDTALEHRHYAWGEAF